MSRYIVAIDQSTSATKAILFNDEAKQLADVHLPHRQYHPQPGWVEHDPIEICNNVDRSIQMLLQQNDVSVNDIDALALTNQRETVVVWDRQTGEPVCNAIVWQCNRAETLCRGFAPHAAFVKERTGLELSPFFSAAKVAWILQNISGARESAQAGRLAMGTIDSWLCYRLTGQHLTDYGNASRTQLLNLRTLQWDRDLLEIFGIPMSMMPELCMTDEPFGTVKHGLLNGKPLLGVLGDSHAALLGHGCVLPGMTKASYGTGSSVVMRCEKPVVSQKLVTSIAWGMEGHVDYILEGNVNCAGATISWLRDGLGLFENGDEVEKLACGVADTGGVYLVPAFAGLGAPHWNSEARGALLGMTLATTKAHVARAAEESLTYQVADIVDTMAREGFGATVLRVDGGGAQSDFLMQLQADMVGLSVERTQISELSAYGSFLAAGIGLGWFALGDMESLTRRGKVFEPVMGEGEREALRAGWKRALNVVLRQYE